MTRFPRLAPALITALLLAACVAPAAGPLSPLATPGPELPKVLEARADAEIIAQMPPRAEKFWLGLPYNTFQILPDAAYQMKARIFALNAADAPKTLTWTTSNESVITVRNGLLRANGKGSAIVTVSGGGQTAKMVVTVADQIVPVTPGLGIGMVGTGSASGTGEGALTAGDTQPGELAAGRQGAAALVVGAHLKVFGGSDGSKALNTLEFANIGEDQDLAFAVDEKSLLRVAREGLSAILSGSNYYLIGGASTTDLERKNIEAEKPFTRLSSIHLNTARRYHAQAEVKNVVVVLGGESPGGEALNSVEAALKLQSTATAQPVASASPVATAIEETLGSFKATGSNLTQARTGATAFGSNNHIYVVGGGSGDKPTNSIERAAYSQTESGAFQLGSFAAASTNLGIPRMYHAMARVGSYLYVLGGIGANGLPLNSIERAELDDSGQPREFQSVGQLTYARSHATAVVDSAHDIIYVIGGRAAQTDLTKPTTTRDVEVVRVSRDGSIQVVAPATPAPSEESLPVVLETPKAATPTPTATPAAGE